MVLAFLFFSPLEEKQEVSFLLDKNKVGTAEERLKVAAAQYRGQDDEGRPFVLTARSALQATSADPVVEISGLTARILLDNGPAGFRADRARYNMDNDQVDVVGPILFTAADGYRLGTRDVTVEHAQPHAGEPRRGRRADAARALLAPTSCSVDLPDRTVVLQRPRPLAYRPGGHQMSAHEPPAAHRSLLPPARRRARARPVAASALKGHDSNAPVDVAADRIEVQDRANRAIFSGNVVVRQGNLTLNAPRLTVALCEQRRRGTEIQRLEASGGVTLRSPTETARSQFAIYDSTGRLVTMIGGVTLDQRRQPRPGRPAGARSRQRPRGDGRRRRRRAGTAGRPRHRPLHRAAAQRQLTAARSRCMHKACQLWPARLIA